MPDDPKEPPAKVSFYQRNVKIVWIGGAIVAATLGYSLFNTQGHDGDQIGVNGEEAFAESGADDDNGLTAQVTSDVLRMAENTKLAFFQWGEACQSPQLFTASDIVVNGKSCNGNMCDVDVNFKLVPTADFFPWHEANPRCTHATMGHERSSFAGGISGRTGVTSYQRGPVDNLTPGGSITFHQVFTYQQFDTGWRFHSKRNW